MAKFFDVTFLTPLISLNAEREGQASFTVTNAYPASIRGDAIVVPEPGADLGWFKIERPSRHYPVGATEQVPVTVNVPKEIAAGTYGFKLRVALGGGVPEEQFDDSDVVQFLVEEVPTPPIEDPKPPPKKFPWWLLIVGAIVLVVVVGVIVFLLLPKPPPPLTGDAIRILSAQPAPQAGLSSNQPMTFQFRIQYSLVSAPQARLYVSIAQFPNATTCTASGSLVVANYALINQGTGETTVSVGWPAAPGSQGTVAPAPSFWQADSSGRIVYFGVVPEYCYRYAP